MASVVEGAGGGQGYPDGFWSSDDDDDDINYYDDDYTPEELLEELREIEMERRMEELVLFFNSFIIKPLNLNYNRNVTF